MVGKNGKTEVNRETFLQLSRAMGVNVCVNDDCKLFYSSGTDAKVKLESGEELRIKFVPHKSSNFPFSKDIYMLYFDIL